MPITTKNNRPLDMQTGKPRLPIDPATGLRITPKFETYNPTTSVLTKFAGDDRASGIQSRNIINSNILNGQSSIFKPSGGSAISDITDIRSGYSPTDVDLSPTQEQSQSFSDRLLQIQGQLTGEGAYRRTQEDEFGVLGLESQKSEISNKINALNRQAEVLGIDRQGLVESEMGAVVGKGVTKAGLVTRVSEKSRAIEQQLRDNAYQVLNLAAQHDMLSGDLVDARNKVDRAVSEKYGALKEEKDLLLENLAIIRDSEAYSEEEKDRAEERAAKVAADKKEIEEQEAEEKAIRNIALTALQNTQDKAIADIINNADTIEEATAVAGRLLEGDWQYVNTPALRDQLISQGYEIMQAGGRTYARQPEAMEKTSDIKEYEFAKQGGFTGSYQDWINFVKAPRTAAPSSYREWLLAGGLEGTGKTYNEWLNESDGLNEEEVAFKKDLDKQREYLANGGSWGTAWNTMKDKYNVPTDKLDQMLNKDKYYNQTEKTALDKQREKFEADLIVGLEARKPLGEKKIRKELEDTYGTIPPVAEKWLNDNF